MLRRLFAVFVAMPLLAVAASAQATTTVCKDGTTSATVGRGACTGHGGVDKSATKKATATVKAEQKAATKAEQKAATKAEQKAATKAPAPTAAPAAAKLPANAPKQAAAATTRPASAATAAPVRPAPAARPTAPTTTHASNTDPTGATAQCKDGTYSHATTHRGACSRHQGVAKWL